MNAFFGRGIWLGSLVLEHLALQRAGGCEIEGEREGEGDEE